MTKKNNIVRGIALVIALVILMFIVGASKKSNPTHVGGTFNPTPVEFSQGITVGGTEVISNVGAWTGAITSALTTALTGSVTIGSTTNGEKNYKPIVTPTTDTTLTASQTGTIFNMGTAGLDLTLPAVASSNGVHYRFVVSASYATTNMTVVSAEGDNIEGSLLVAGAVVDCDANDVITSVNDGENIGDFFDLYSNGTYWYIGASGGLTAAKLTCSG